MFNLAGTDAKGQGTKSSMGGCVAITAHNSGTRESETLFGSNDVNDSLTLISESEVSQTEVLDIIFQGNTLSPRILFFDEFSDVFEVLAGRSWDVLGFVSLSTKAMGGT